MSHIQPDTTLPKTPKVKIYSALISQTGTATPTVIVLQNTLGEITWTRVDIGEYAGTTDGLYTLDKTWSIMRTNAFNFGYQVAARQNENVMGLYTGVGSTPTDGQLNKVSIEIRVYE